MPHPPPFISTIGIIGRGRVGTSLGAAWTQAGHAVRFLAAGGKARPVDILVLAVPDRAIAEVALAWRGRVAARVVAHVSGSQALDVLAPLSSSTTHLGSLHPLLAVARKRSPLRGGWAAIEGDPTARRALRRLALDAGLRPFAQGPSDRTLYHLGAALAANSLAPLLAAAVDLLAEAGLSRTEATRGLAELMKSALASVVRTGAVEGLTGPIARGDIETVARHLRALRTQSTAARQLYVAAGLAAVELARRRRPAPPYLDAMARSLRSRG